jgi:hypothetical protein
VVVAAAPAASAQAPTVTLEGTPTPSLPPPVRLAPEERYRGRLGLYLMVGGGVSMDRAPVVPVLIGLAVRWRLVSLALEGIGGLWGGGFVGGDVAVMLRRAVGPVLLGGGLAGGAAVAGQPLVDPIGVARAFVRVDWAVHRRLDLFAQLDFAYGRNTRSHSNSEGLMLSIGVQLRFLP